jgi:hypothetical protein
VAAVVLDGKIYALAGRMGVGSAYTSMEVYDPAMDAWSPGPDMTDSRAGFAAAAIDGRIYVAGGEVLIPPFSVRDSVEELDVAAGSWSFKTKLPGPLHGVGAAAHGGKMYVFGGAANPASAMPRTGTVNVFQP